MANTAYKTLLEREEIKVRSKTSYGIYFEKSTILTGRVQGDKHVHYDFSS